MQLDDQTFCFLGKNSKINGDLFLEGPTHISSNITGKIVMNKEHLLSIEPMAEIEGTITGHNIDLYGRVSGDIIAAGTLRIFPSAVVNGVIKANNLIIKPGATVNMTGHTTAQPT